MPLYCMKTQAAKHPWRCQRHCADVGQTFVAFLFQPFREKMLGAADVSWNQCIKSDALHHPKKTDKSWFPPMQWNKTCFFHLQSFSFFISFTPLSAILFTFLCWRTENQTWMKFTLMEFLGTDQLMKNSAIAVDQIRPEATQTASETPETFLKETAASRQRAFTPPRHWEIKRLLISELWRLKMSHWFVDQISEDFIVWSGLRRNDASSVLDNVLSISHLWMWTNWQIPRSKSQGSRWHGEHLRCVAKRARFVGQNSQNPQVAEDQKRAPPTCPRPLAMKCNSFFHILFSLSQSERSISAKTRWEGTLLVLDVFWIVSFCCQVVKELSRWSVSERRVLVQPVAMRLRTHCPTLGGARVPVFWDVVRFGGWRVFFSVLRLTAIVLCYFFAFIHVVWKRWSSTCCIPGICQNQLQSVLISLISLISFGWIALCCTSTEVAMFRNIAERQVSFGTPEGAADLWQVLGILASPCDKLDFMEDGRWLHSSKNFNKSKKNIEETGKKSVTIRNSPCHSCDDILILWLTSRRSPSAASLQRSGSTRSLSPRRPREEVKELIPCDWNSLFTLVGDLGILQSQACDACVSCVVVRVPAHSEPETAETEAQSIEVGFCDGVSIAVRVSVVAVLPECFYHSLLCSRFCASCEMSRRSHLEAAVLSFHRSIYWQHYLRVIGVVSGATPPARILSD